MSENLENVESPMVALGLLEELVNATITHVKEK